MIISKFKPILLGLAVSLCSALSAAEGPPMTVAIPELPADQEMLVL